MEGYCCYKTKVLLLQLVAHSDSADDEADVLLVAFSSDETDLLLAAVAHSADETDDHAVAPKIVGNGNQ